MREKTEIMSMRIPHSLYAVLMAMTKKSGLYFSDVLKLVIKNGLNSKEMNNELKEKTEFYKRETAFDEGDEELRIAMKEAYSVSNFKKLVNQLWGNSEVSRVKKMQVIQKLFDRIEKTEGNNSESYCEAQKWLISNYPNLVYRSKESGFKAKSEKDIIIE